MPATQAGKNREALSQAGNTVMGCNRIELITEHWRPALYQDQNRRISLCRQGSQRSFLSGT